MRKMWESVNGDWPRVRLDELCEKRIPTRDPRNTPDEPFTYADISSVDNSAKRIVAAKQVRGRDASSRARQVIRAGDVLVSTTRPNLNAVALVPSELDDEIASTGFCVLRPLPSLDREFLFAFVQSREFASALSDLVKGALYPAVTDGQVRAQKIPLPPLEEQRRIAERLREQLAAVSQARAALEAQLAAAEALPAANLRAIFQSPASQCWPRVKLADLCDIVAAQVNPTLPEFSALPHVSGENIESGTCRLRAVRSAAEDGMMSGKYLFEPGDVLYSKLRPYLRKVAVAPFRGLCSADMYPIRMNENRFDARFAAWLLLSVDFTKYAVGASQRSRMPKLNREQLFAWHAPTPPLAEQRAIAARLDAEFSAATALRAALAARLSEVEKLPAALLRAAFAGAKENAASCALGSVLF